MNPSRICFFAIFQKTSANYGVQMFWLYCLLPMVIFYQKFSNFSSLLSKLHKIFSVIFRLWWKIWVFQTKIYQKLTSAFYFCKFFRQTQIFLLLFSLFCRQTCDAHPQICRSWQCLIYHFKVLIFLVDIHIPVL